MSTTVNSVKWWEPLNAADDKLRASPYLAPYVNLRECSPDMLGRLATWLREVADMLDEGARLKEAQHGETR